MLLVLRQLQTDGSLIDLRLQSGDVRGYIEEMSEELLLVAVATDHVTMGGFFIIRIEDIEFARWGDQRHIAWHAALAYDGLSLKRAGSIDLGDWHSAIVDVASRERIVTFHTDEPEICYLGTNVALQGDVVTADQITTEGRRDGRFAMPVERLRRVDFGGPYERGLQRMLDMHA